MSTVWWLYRESQHVLNVVSNSEIILVDGMGCIRSRKGAKRPKAVP